MCDGLVSLVELSVSMKKILWQSRLPSRAPRTVLRFAGARGIEAFAGPNRNASAIFWSGSASAHENKIRGRSLSARNYDALALVAARRASPWVAHSPDLRSVRRSV